MAFAVTNRKYRVMLTHSFNAGPPKSTHDGVLTAEEADRELERILKIWSSRNGTRIDDLVIEELQ